MRSPSYRRTRSFLVDGEIGGLAGRETAVVAGIARGLDDARAGNVVDHEAAMDELDAAIERAARQPG